MAKLTAEKASKLAADIYQVKGDNLDPEKNRLLATVLKRHSDCFELNASNKVEGQSGWYFINQKTGFGIVVNGKGVYKNDVFIILRGTDTAYDWMTDLNVGVSYSTSGNAVHQGFNYCFNSISGQLESFFRANRQHINRVHCIGHSLGGALATLAAEWVLSRNLCSEVFLYTFGAPRVGMNSYVKEMTRLMAGSGEVSRLLHCNDPVPMIPVWPFEHMFENNAMNMQYHGLFISPSAHFMGNYVETVEKNDGSWAQLQAACIRGYGDNEVERWLLSKGASVLTTRTVHMLNRSLAYVLKKIALIVGVGLQAILSPAVTLLDRLAYILHQGFNASQKVSAWVVALIHKMASALGVKIKEGVDLTITLIRYILNKMTDYLNALVRKAVDFVTQSIV